MVDLTNLELFKDFIIIEHDGNIYDLHSDYECKSVRLDSIESKLTLQFQRRDNEQPLGQKVSIEFNESRLSSLSLSFPFTQDSSTLNIIYRGRFEENGELREYSDLGERYFYFEFETGDKFELYSKRVYFVMNGR